MEIPFKTPTITNLTNLSAEFFVLSLGERINLQILDEYYHWPTADISQKAF